MRIRPACSRGSPSPTTAGGDRPRWEANLIMAEEIECVHFSDASELGQAMRPTWIQPRGAMSMQDPTAGEVVVYLDGRRFGGAELVRQFRAGNVACIENLDGTEASARFGLGHIGGAILIQSKRDR